MKPLQQGFTLIELMIVVLTLAILATIAYPSYETYIRQTRLENVRADLLVNAQTLERYYAQNKRFPITYSASNPYFDIEYKPVSGDNFRLIATAANNNPRENRQMEIDGNGIIKICKASEGCHVYK